MCLVPTTRVTRSKTRLVRFSLGSQSTQSVPIRLDFVAMEHTANRCEVDPSQPLAKPQFLNQCRVWRSQLLSVQIRPKCRSYPHVPAYGHLGRTRPEGGHYRTTVLNEAVSLSLSDAFQHEV